MKRTKIILIAIAVLALCGLGVVFFVGKHRLNELSARTKSSTQTSDVVSDNISGNASGNTGSMESKMKMLQRKIDHLSFRQLSMENSQTPKNYQNGELDDTTLKDEEEQPIDNSVDLMEESYVESENQGLLIDSQMVREGRDPEWSDQAESGIAANVSNLSLPDLASEEITCSASICKVSLDFGLKQNLDMAMNDNLQQFTKLATWNSGGFFRADKQGSLHLYFPREGSELPRL